MRPYCLYLGHRDVESDIDKCDIKACLLALMFFFCASPKMTISTWRVCNITIVVIGIESKEVKLAD